MKRRGTSNAPPCKQRPPPSARRLLTGVTPKVAHPFLFGTAFAKLLGRAVSESGRHTDRAIRARIVVGIAVGVGVARVGRVEARHAAQPHVRRTCDAQPAAIIAAPRSAWPRGPVGAALPPRQRPTCPQRLPSQSASRRSSRLAEGRSPRQGVPASG